MELQEKLVTQRKKQGLTQAQLAEQLQVTRQAVSRWEVGDAVPSMENLKSLSQLYQLSIEYFLNDNAEEPEKIAVPATKEEQRNQSRHWNRKTSTLAAVLCVLLLLIAALLIIVIRKQDAPKIYHMDEVEQSEVPPTLGEDFVIEW